MIVPVFILCLVGSSLVQSQLVKSSRAALGAYVQDNSGAYNANDGRYHPDQSGQYRPDGAGSYKHSDSKYQHQDDRYKHQGDVFGAGGGAGGAGADYTSGSGQRVFSGSGQRVLSGAGLSRFGSGSGSGFGSENENVRLVSVPVPVLVDPNQEAPLVSAQRPVQTAYKKVASAEYTRPVTVNRAQYDNAEYNHGIIRKTEHVEQDGYHYLYETENGITAEEQGKLASIGKDEEAMKASGFYKYTGPDNVVYTVEYTADENGFVPVGVHIPTPPPIPAAILRSLEYQRSLGLL